MAQTYNKCREKKGLAGGEGRVYILEIDVDPQRDDDASPMPSYRCMLRVETYLNVYG